MSAKKIGLPYIRRRAFNKIHVTSWLIYLEKDGYVRCSFQNCNFMAFDVEEMCNHYGYCKGDSNFAQYVCEHCNGRTVSEAKLRQHLARAHNIDLSEEPEQGFLAPQPAMGSSENGKPSRVLVVSWGYFLEKHNYLKCTSCNYLSSTLSEMCRHYSMCKQEVENLLYVCPECKGRTVNVNPLLWHMERSHGIFKAPIQFNHITKTMLRFWKREIEDNGYASCLHIFNGKRDCFYFNSDLVGIIEHAQCCKGPQPGIVRQECPHCSRWTDSKDKLKNHIASCYSQMSQTAEQVDKSTSENIDRLDSFNSQSSTGLKISDHRSVSPDIELELRLEPVEEIVITENTEYLEVNKEETEEFNERPSSDYTASAEASEEGIRDSTIQIVKEEEDITEQLFRDIPGSSTDEQRSSSDIENCNQSEEIGQEVVIENEPQSIEGDQDVKEEGMVPEKVIVVEEDELSKTDKRRINAGFEGPEMKKTKLLNTGKEITSDENVIINNKTSKTLPCPVITEDNSMPSISNDKAVDDVGYSEEDCRENTVENEVDRVIRNTTPGTAYDCKGHSEVEPVLVDLCSEKSNNEGTSEVVLIECVCDSKEENLVNETETVVNSECSTDKNMEVQKMNVKQSKIESFKKRCFTLFADEFSSDEDDALVIQDNTQEEEKFIVNIPPNLSISECKQSSETKVPKNYLRRPGHQSSSRFSPTKRPSISADCNAYLKTKRHFEDPDAAFKEDTSAKDTASENDNVHDKNAVGDEPIKYNEIKSQIQSDLGKCINKNNGLLDIASKNSEKNDKLMSISYSSNTDGDISKEVSTKHLETNLFPSQSSMGTVEVIGMQYNITQQKDFSKLTEYNCHAVLKIGDEGFDEKCFASDLAASYDTTTSTSDHSKHLQVNAKTFTKNEQDYKVVVKIQSDKKQNTGTNLNYESCSIQPVSKETSLENVIQSNQNLTEDLGKDNLEKGVRWTENSLENSVISSGLFSSSNSEVDTNSTYKNKNSTNKINFMEEDVKCNLNDTYAKKKYSDVKRRNSYGLTADEAADTPNNKNNLKTIEKIYFDSTEDNQNSVAGPDLFALPLNVKKNNFTSESENTDLKSNSCDLGNTHKTVAFLYQGRLNRKSVDSNTQIRDCAKDDQPCGTSAHLRMDKIRFFQLDPAAIKSFKRPELFEEASIEAEEKENDGWITNDKNIQGEIKDKFINESQTNSSPKIDESAKYKINRRISSDWCDESSLDEEDFLGTDEELDMKDHLFNGFQELSEKSKSLNRRFRQFINRLSESENEEWYLNAGNLSMDVRKEENLDKFSLKTFSSGCKTPRHKSTRCGQNDINSSFFDENNENIDTNKIMSNGHFESQNESYISAPLLGTVENMTTLNGNEEKEVKTLTKEFDINYTAENGPDIKKVDKGNSTSQGKYSSETVIINFNTLNNTVSSESFCDDSKKGTQMNSCAKRKRGRPPQKLGDAIYDLRKVDDLADAKLKSNEKTKGKVANSLVVLNDRDENENKNKPLYTNVCNQSEQKTQYSSEKNSATCDKTAPEQKDYNGESNIEYLFNSDVLSENKEEIEQECNKIKMLNSSEVSLNNKNIADFKNKLQIEVVSNSDFTPQKFSPVRSENSDCSFNDDNPVTSDDEVLSNIRKECILIKKNTVNLTENNCESKSTISQQNTKNYVENNEVLEKPLFEPVLSKKRGRKPKVNIHASSMKNDSTIPKKRGRKPTLKFQESDSVVLKSDKNTISAVNVNEISLLGNCFMSDMNQSNMGSSIGNVSMPKRRGRPPNKTCHHSKNQNEEIKFSSKTDFVENYKPSIDASCPLLMQENTNEYLFSIYSDEADSILRNIGFDESENESLCRSDIKMFGLSETSSDALLTTKPSSSDFSVTSQPRKRGRPPKCKVNENSNMKMEMRKTNKTNDLLDKNIRKSHLSLSKQVDSLSKSKDDQTPIVASLISDVNVVNKSVKKNDCEGMIVSSECEVNDIKTELNELLNKNVPENDFPFPKKRGRPRKCTLYPNKATVCETGRVNNKRLELNEFIQSKKRGRKPKLRLEDSQLLSINQTDINLSTEKKSDKLSYIGVDSDSCIPKKRARKPKMVHSIDRVDIAQSTPKRRGRPPKNRMSEIGCYSSASKLPSDSVTEEVSDINCINNPSGLLGTDIILINNEKLSGIFSAPKKRTRKPKAKLVDSTNLDETSIIVESDSSYGGDTSLSENNSGLLKRKRKKIVFEEYSVGDESDDESDERPKLKKKHCAGRPKKGSKGPRIHKPAEASFFRSRHSASDRVVCGVCKEVMTYQVYKGNHAVYKHYMLCWLDEEETPLDMNDAKEVVNRLWYAKKRLGKIPFKCFNCNLPKLSAVGFQSHIRFCGKQHEEKESLLVTCELCGVRIMPSSMKPHLYAKHNSGNSTMSSLDESVIIPKSRRAAASRAVEVIQSQNDNNEEAEPHTRPDSPDSKQLLSHMYMKPSKLIPPDEYARWKTSLQDTNLVTCQYPECSFTADSTVSFRKHYLSCRYGPPRYYKCRHCEFVSTVEKAIREHVLEKHEEQLQQHHSSVSGSSDGSGDERASRHQFYKAYTSHLPFKFLKSGFPSRVRGHPRKYFFTDALTWTQDLRKKNLSSEVLFSDIQPSSSSWLPLSAELTTQYLPQEQTSIKFHGSDNSWHSLTRFQGTLIDDVPVIFTGGPVWAAAWAPVPDSESKQYLAVATHPNMDITHKMASVYNYKSLIQIWAFGYLNNIDVNSSETPKFVMGVAHSRGAVWGLQWCASGCYQDTRLGLLAAACADGSVAIYSVPRYRPNFESVLEYTIYNVQPVMELKLGCEMLSQCTCLEWHSVAPHNLMAAGFSNGMVGLWDLTVASPLLRDGVTIYPYKVIEAHLSSVSAVKLSPTPDDIHMMTASLDRDTKFWRLDDTTVPVNTLRKASVVDAAMPANWLTSINAYDDVFSINSSHILGYNYRETFSLNNSNYLLQSGTVWSISFNDWLNACACASEMGKVSVFFRQQLLVTEDSKKVKKDSLIGDIMQCSVQSLNSSSVPENIGQKYSDIINSMGLEINFKETFNDTNKSKSSCSTDTMDSYPILSVNKVTWNSNYNSFTWMAVGLQCGLVMAPRAKCMPTKDLFELYRLKDER